MAKAYKAKWILTSSIDNQQVYENSALIVDEGKIIDIIPQEDLIEEDYQRVEDFGNAVITPGFINLGVKLHHTDLFEIKNNSFCSKIKGFFQTIHKFFAMLGVPINSYPSYLANLQKEYYCWNKEDKINSFYNGIQKSILQGTTCLAQVSSENKYFEILNNIPIKTYLFFEIFADSNQKSKDEFRRISATVENLQKNKSDSTFVGIYPNSIPTVHKRLWKILGKYTRKNNILLMTEISESEEESQWYEYGYSDIDFYNKYLGYKKLSYEEKEKSPCNYLRDLKVLGKNLIVKNGNFLKDEDLKTLSEAQVQLVYSPKYDDKMFEKKQDFSTLLRFFPQKIGFSTETIPQYCDFNMLNEISSIDSMLPFEEYLKYITIYPAQILRLDNIIGSLDKGKDADFNVFSLKNKQLWSEIKENPTPRFVYSKGKVLVKDSKLQIKLR